MSIESKLSLWLASKAAEKEAVETRRAIEDDLVAELGITTDSEGQSSLEIDDFKVKVTTRMSRKVDGDLVQTIAAEHGIPLDILQNLFRWKPEINMRQWKSADEDLTAILSKAVTTKPSRPSFLITKEAK